MQAKLRAFRDIVVVAASAGGVAALRTLFEQIPAGFPGTIFAVLHRDPAQPNQLPRVLRGSSGHALEEPANDEAIRPGHIYLAPADRHLVIENRRMKLVRGPKEHFTRPAADPLFRSAASAYGSRVVGVVLTGGGGDGVSGLIAIKAAGGLALVQDPSEAQVRSMPVHAISGDDVDAVLTLDEIAATIRASMNGARATAGRGRARRG